MNENHPNWLKYISDIFKRASNQARKQALNDGYSVLYIGKNGNLYEEHPNGTITLKKISIKQQKNKKNEYAKINRKKAR